MEGKIVYVDSNTREKIMKIAEKEDRTIVAVIRRAIEKYNSEN